MTPRPLLAPAHWSRQERRRLVVTGATGGLGFFSALRLAALGAEVVLAGRSPQRLDAAATAITAEVPDARLERIRLDTSRLDVVAEAAATMRALGPLDGLLLNAGLVRPAPRRTESPDGHELTLATNAIGHFALAARLLPALGAGARLVWLGSLTTRLHHPTLVDPQVRTRYTPTRAYAESKLAAHVLGHAWHRRAQAAGRDLSSVVAHPGYALSGLTRRVAGVNEPTGRERAIDGLQRLVTGATSKEAGSESQVAALVDPTVRSGEVVGPRWTTRGRPVRQWSVPLAYRDDVGDRLWRDMVAWTGVEPRF